MNKINIKVSKRKIISTSKYSTKYNLIVLLIILNPVNKREKSIKFQRLNYIYSIFCNLSSDSKVGLLSGAWDIKKDVRPLLIKGREMGYWDLNSKKTGLFVEISDKGKEVLDEILKEVVFDQINDEVQGIKKQATQANIDKQKLVW